MHRHPLAPACVAIVALTSLACIAPPAGAQLRVTADITGFVGYRYGGKVELDSVTVTLDPSVSYGFMADWTVLRSEEMTVFLEFLFSEQRTDVNEERPGEEKRKVDRMKLRYFQGASALAWDWSRLRGYLVLSIGLTRYLAEERGDKNGFTVGMGLGLKYPTRSRFGVRIDSRWYGTKTDVKGTTWICPDVGDCLNVNETIWLWQGDLVGGLFFAF
ncbi:MAG: hypothetical protein JSW67_02390 [Candidatus Latescibacterota bacterium]|nr:MAG: hypothetical protein JSW67_02390 [Candidatus Latescibacterota bacterium]